jgi:DNA-binding NtrC family response regulator
MPNGRHLRGPAPQRRPHADSTALVIEPAAQLLAVLSEFLRSLDLVVIPAADADTARVLLERLRVDILVARLDETDTVESEFIAEARQWQPELAVVLIRTAAVPEGSEGSECAGADAVLHRPLDLDHLRAAVLGAIKNRRARGR